MYDIFVVRTFPCAGFNGRGPLLAGGVQRSDSDEIFSVFLEEFEESGALIGGQCHRSDRPAGNRSIFHTVLLDLLGLNWMPAHAQAVRSQIRHNDCDGAKGL